MEYTISEAAKKCNMPASTLRYYDNQGLMPRIKKNKAGQRRFSDNDLAWIKILDCLKVSGLKINEIKQYADLTIQGDEALTERLGLFEKQRAEILTQMEELKKSLHHIDYKRWYYQKAIEAGTESIHFKDGRTLSHCYQEYLKWVEAGGRLD